MSPWHRVLRREGSSHDVGNRSGRDAAEVAT
jgi:alkylated DNA nucleotide flippase Atl1